MQKGVYQEELKQYLDTRCGGPQNWRYLSHGSFGQVFQCRGRYALKVQPLRTERDLLSVRSENTIPKDISNGCALPPQLDCGVLQPTAPLDIQYLPRSKTYISVIQFPFISGGSGEEFLKTPTKAKAWDAENIVANFYDLVNTVTEMHRLGILHRDIKPANILIENIGSNRYRLWLTDFGLACSLGAAAPYPTCSGLNGTTAYLDPRAIFSNAVKSRLSPTVDVYALGVSMWEMIMGKSFLSNALLGYISRLLDKPNSFSVQARQALMYELIANYQDRTNELFAMGARKKSTSSQWDEMLHMIANMTRPFDVAQRPSLL